MEAILVFECFHKIHNIAASVCGCKPLYLDKSNKLPCDTFGLICYEKSIQNESQNLDVQKRCYPACKDVMYSLEEKTKEVLKDRFGGEFSSFFEDMLILDMGMSKWQPLNM